jgi:hypothetical protein
MRHELRTADGVLVWAGNLEAEEDSFELRQILNVAANRARVRQRRTMRMAMGICVECGAYKIAKGHASLCPSCRDDRRVDAK